MCRVAGVDCYYLSSDIDKSSRKRRSRPVEGQSTSNREPTSHNEPEAQCRDLETLVDEESELTGIVGPLLADDAKIVHQHYLPGMNIHERSQYRVFSDDTRESVLYTKVSRRRPGSQYHIAAGAEQRIIMEQILGNCTEDLVNT